MSKVCDYAQNKIPVWCFIRTLRFLNSGLQMFLLCLTSKMLHQAKRNKILFPCSIMFKGHIFTSNYSKHAHTPNVAITDILSSSFLIDFHSNFSSKLRKQERKIAMTKSHQFERNTKTLHQNLVFFAKYFVGRRLRNTAPFTDVPAQKQTQSIPLTTSASCNITAPAYNNTVTLYSKVFVPASQSREVLSWVQLCIHAVDLLPLVVQRLVPLHACSQKAHSFLCTIILRVLW